MRLSPTSAILATVAVLVATPGWAIAGGPPSGIPGPGASPAAKAKAYGKHCQGQSKKHVAGQKGTPFSQCVVGAAKLEAAQHGDDGSTS